tara:strand:+ start:1034 stop:1351 length:318 start_codon:yes stop_codon:yes gene_type:complete
MLKEPKENIAFTCKSHSIEQYFKIKEMEKHNKQYVYCVFEVDHEHSYAPKEINTERMWVEIEFGDQKNGSGYLRNDPHFIATLHNGDRCSFYTDKKGITHGELMQ